MNLSVAARFKKNVPVFFPVFVEIARETHVVKTIFFYVLNPPLAEPLERFKAVAGFALAHGRAGKSIEPDAMSQKIHHIFKYVGNRDPLDNPRRYVRRKHGNIKKLRIEPN